MSIENLGMNLPREGSSETLLHQLSPDQQDNRFRGRDHFVQFYENDRFLVDSVTDFIGNGLRDGDNCIVIATEPHRAALAKGLLGRGFDVVSDGLKQRYYALDANDTLSSFRVDGAIKPKLFHDIVGGILQRAGGSGRKVRAFGEMVALLAGRGAYDEAIELELLWNELRRQFNFSLFCAYPLSDFTEDDSYPLLQICHTHSRVIPAESYNVLTSPEDRLRAIVMLQQKAQALERQIAERQQIENTLRSVREELEAQVEELRRLQEMTLRLAETLDVQTVLEEVLNVALCVQGTTMGLLSLIDPNHETLTDRDNSPARQRS